MVSTVRFFASATLALVLCLQLSSVQPSGATERPGSQCFVDGDGNYNGCDPGRCCSSRGYCGDDFYHCTAYCWKQCFDEVDEVTGQGQRRHNVSTTSTNVVNATYNEFYDDRPNNNTIASSSSSSMSSCVSSTTTSPSSNDIPTAAMRNKYAPAAFRRPGSQAAENSSSNTETYCGQCLKLENLETRVEAMVRIVHERKTEGLELDRGTFNKLRSYGPENEDDDHDHHLVLKYHFEDCQD